jgi:type IV secretory pathway VirB4 component
MLFKKKPKEQAESTPVLGLDQQNQQSNQLATGVPSMKDLVAPPSFDRSNPDYIKVGNKFVRNFIIAGYPKMISVGWADTIYNYDGDLDLAIHINPTDERNALDELTNKITQFEAQLATEIEKGSNRNITRLQSQIQELYAERQKVEQNYISIFGIQMIMNLYCQSLDQLNKETQLLDNSLKGRKIKLMPMYLQMDQGYKSALPFGKTWLPKNYRNFSSEGLTACFPFYNAEISHVTGVFLGVNLQTATPVYIDFYDRKILNNGNVTVFGCAGSGKTFLVSLLTMRSALKQIRTVIIDPEGEYRTITQSLGGATIVIAPDSTALINPFDIEEEDEVDDDGTPTGAKVVKINEKVADLLNLIGVMCGNIDNEQRSLISYVISEVYADFGFTEDPSSLYVEQAALNEAGEFVHHGRKKPMPTFSDFHRKLEEVSKMDANKCLVNVANALRMFKKGGVYGMFDNQTSPNLQNFKDAPVVTFDVSQLEESILRPIGMFIALNWAWEKFAKKNVKQKKRIVCDEAWMLTNKNMAGHEFTAQFLETTSRRIRKRNGGLLVASQNFKEFSDNPQGQAVLTNASVNVFLKQNATDIDDVAAVFKLSDGEKNFLSTAKKGHFLLKMGQESTVAFAKAFEYEKYLIERKTIAASR